MKVLLADDDQDQLDLRRMVLSKSGYDTIAVTSAAAALEQAKIQHPQCAVIDLKIPTEAIGLGLIRALKAFDTAMRVFVLTGGDPKRIDGLPEKQLVEEVIVKGSSTAYLMKKLGELADNPQAGLQRLRAALVREGTVTFKVKAVPRAAVSEVVGLTTDGSLKVRIAAVPDKGKANEELRHALADWFQVPRSNVELLQGETSQRKVLRVRK